MQDKLDFTFLETKEIYGRKRLDIFKKINSGAEITDFAILSGAVAFQNNNSIYDSNEKKLYGWYWTKTQKPNDKEAICVIDSSSTLTVSTPFNCNLGARPAIPYSSIKNCSSDIKIDKFGVKTIEFGEYPQTIASEKEKEILDEEIYQERIIPTGKIYTSILAGLPVKHTEYKYKKNKYIRVLCTTNNNGKTLSNKSVTWSGRYYWIKVEPIKWLVDTRKDIALSEKILFAGQEFNNELYYEGFFDMTTIKNFMDENFAKEIIAIKTKNYQEQLEDTNDFENKIEIYLNEIEKKLENIQNKDIIKNKVNGLIEEHNKNIDKIIDSNLKDRISLVPDRNTLERFLIVNLETIIGKIDFLNKTNSEYHKVLKLLNTIINIFEGNEESEEKGIVKEFTVIHDYVLPYLHFTDKIKLEDKIKIIINNEKEMLENYLKTNENIEEELFNNDKKLDYNSYDEFEIKLRKLMTPILLELNDKVNKRDIEYEITEALKDIRDSLYQETTNKMLKVYLNEINRLSEEIDRLRKLSNMRFSPYEKLAILSTKIDFNKDITEVLKEINKIIIELHQVIFDLNEEIEIKKSYVKVRMK